ncbi:MAG TPA: hypothetical protein VLT33_46430 [Labilithrix sp.]|nr:hypothetical protein [Labilithrix sp.]
MSKRRKEPTGKVSVTVTAEDLLLLRARAKRLHQGNLSAAVADGVSRLREEEATHRLLERLDAPALSDERYQAIVAEWRTENAPAFPVKKKKTRRASAT